MSGDTLDEPGGAETGDGTGEVDSGGETGAQSGESTEGGTVLGRRTVLAGVAGGIVALLAFLASNPDAVRDFFDPTHENAGAAAWLDREEEETDTVERVVGTVRLESGQYTAQSFWARGAGVDLSWSVDGIEEGSLDVWLLPDDHIDRYQDGEEPRFVADLSETGIDAATEQAGEVTDGDWWLVLDNTSLYGSEADDAVEFDVEMEITTA